MDRNDWDDRYRASELVWGAQPNRFLVEEVSDLTPGKALDLGCGEGRNALWLAELGWKVTAVDFSSVALAKARRLAAGRGLEADFVEADVLAWEPPGPEFDLVVIMYLHLPPDSWQRALRTAAGALAPGGTLLVVGHDKANLEEGTGGPQDPDVLLTPEEVASQLTGLAILRAVRKRRPVSTDQGEREAVDTVVRAKRPAAAYR